jgi:stage II sporulation protein E
MILILFYGWKEGAINACAAGIITGLFATCINNSELDLVIVLGVGGLLAGVFRRFGKVSIVIAFVLGNIYISYYTNNFSDIVARVTEMLIASVALLFLPKNLELKLENLFNKGKTLEKPYENVLDCASSIKNKIGAISDVFDTLSNIKLDETDEDKIETREVIKKYITNYIEENCISCQNKSVCKDEEKLKLDVDYISSKFENNEDISKDMLTFECENFEKLYQDLKEVYSSIKLMRIMKQKEKESSDKLSKQYKEISKLLNNISESMEKNTTKQEKLQQVLRNELKMYGFVIYEDEFKKENNDIEYTFVTDILTNIDKQKKQIISIASNILEKNVSIKLILNSSKKEKSKIKIVTIPNFEIKTAIVAEKKSFNDVSGDSYLCMELSDLKHVNILSDGAGSGKIAAKGSQTVINLLEKLLESGFDEENSVKIINSFLKLKGNDTIFSTLDTFIFNLKNAQAQFIKLGAAPTYILKNSKVITISNINIPLGLISESNYVPIVSDLDDMSIVIQLTDGVIDETYEYNDNYITKYLQNLDITKSTKLIADELHKLILKEKNNDLKDDFTVIVSKVCKNLK